MSRIAHVSISICDEADLDRPDALHHFRTWIIPGDIGDQVVNLMPDQPFEEYLVPNAAIDDAPLDIAGVTL